MQNSQEFFLRCGTEKLNWKQEIDTKYDNIFVNHENFFFSFKKYIFFHIWDLKKRKCLQR